MKRKLFVYLALVFSVVFGVNVTAQTPNTLKARMFALVNHTRQTQGVGYVSFDPALETAAQAYACELIKLKATGNPNYLSHTDLYGRDSLARAKASGWTGGGTGENLASGYFYSPNEVVAGWMNSPGHRKVLLNSGWTKMGLGHCQSEIGIDSIWVQLFG